MPRIEIEGGWFHVYNRVSSGEPIFADPDVAIEFVEIVRDVKNRDGWTVIAWCLMSNHYHLVVRTSSVPLWRGMHGIQNRFSRGFNRRHGRTGPLWQSRYRAMYVEEQSYLDRLVLYVHLNPVTGGLVEDPEDYPFAGHREVKRRFRSPLVDVDDMLLCFGDRQEAARRSYLKAIRVGIDPESPEPVSTWHPFGDTEDEVLKPGTRSVSHTMKNSEVPDWRRMWGAGVAPTSALLDIESPGYSSVTPLLFRASSAQQLWKCARGTRVSI
jgi:REP element-mobilizing transposase RayT